MSVTINAKGTSVSSFTVGKHGTVITQGGTISPPAATDLTINLDTNHNLVVDAGVSGPALITTTNSQDLHINPAVGGGQYLVINATRWPTNTGTAGQTLISNGAGVLSWQDAPGTGTVASVSVASANGFSGSVATSTTTPVITMLTTVTGLVKGNGTALSAASASDVTTLVNGTYVNVTGDTMTGSLVIDQSTASWEFITLTNSNTGGGTNVRFNNTASPTNGWDIGLPAATDAMHVRRGASSILSISSAGAVTATSFNATSTARVKNAIVDIGKSYLDKFDLLKPREYDRTDSQAHEFGFIAEEMENVYPEVVGRDETGRPSGIDYGKLSTILTAKIQEQQNTINEMKSQMSAVMALLNMMV